MGDPTSRRNQTRNRLRAQLRKKRESLADQFDFKIYIAFVFKEKVCLQIVAWYHQIFLFLFTFGLNDYIIEIGFFACFSITDEEVSTFWGSWSGASDDQQLWRKHLTRCAGVQLLSREFNRTPAKRRRATTRPPIPVNAKGKIADHLKKGQLKTSCCINQFIFFSVVGCDRLHAGDGLHSLAAQWYREDRLPAVLQMEGGRGWTL